MLGVYYAEGTDLSGASYEGLSSEAGVAYT